MYHHIEDILISGYVSYSYVLVKALYVVCAVSIAVCVLYVKLSMRCTAKVVIKQEVELCFINIEAARQPLYFTYRMSKAMLQLF